MELREIGRSGIQTNPIGLGCWAIGGGNWGDNDDRVSVDTIKRAVELGVTWVDTAPAYNFCHSEQVVGMALKEIPRDRIILSTKCGLQWYDGGGEFHFVRDGREVHRDLRPQAIRRDLENSLRVMGTDYIDILYTHWQCKTYGLVPVAETMGELLRMKEEGKIRAIGACNVDLQVLQDYVAAGELDVIQEKVNLLDRKPVEALLPFCEAHGIALQAYSPIEQGLLAGKIPNDYVTRPGEVRDGKPWWKPENIALVNAMLAGWKDLTDKYGCTLAQLCVRWNAMLSPNVHVLCGARKVSQIEDTAGSMEVPLTREDFLRMKDDADALMKKQV